MAIESTPRNYYQSDQRLRNPPHHTQHRRSEEQHTPAVLLLMLLRRAGVELNPVPWTCSVCWTQRKNNIHAVRCSNCQVWCHFKRCSGLISTHKYTSSFVASCCKQCKQQLNQQPPQTIQQTKNARPTTYPQQSTYSN